MRTGRVYMIFVSLQAAGRCLASMPSSIYRQNVRSVLSEHITQQCVFSILTRGHWMKLMCAAVTVLWRDLRSCCASAAVRFTSHTRLPWFMAILCFAVDYHIALIVQPHGVVAQAACECCAGHLRRLCSRFGWLCSQDGWLHRTIEAVAQDDGECCAANLCGYAIKLGGCSGHVTI